MSLATYEKKKKEKERHEEEIRRREEERVNFFVKFREFFVKSIFFLFQRKRHEERMRKEKEKQLEEEIMRKRGKKFREIVKFS